MHLIVDPAFEAVGKSAPVLSEESALELLHKDTSFFQTIERESSLAADVLFLKLYSTLSARTVLTPALTLTLFPDGTLRRTHHLFRDTLSPDRFSLLLDEKLDLKQSVAFVSCPSPPPSNATGHEMFVKTMTGKTITIQCNPATTTFWRFCQAVRQKEGIPEDQMRLIFAGRLLTADPNNFACTLKDLGLQSQSTLHMVLRLRGGMHHETSGREDYDANQVDSYVDLFPSPTTNQVQRYVVPPGTRFGDLEAMFRSHFANKEN